jgi:hypothetical protein
LSVLKYTCIAGYMTRCHKDMWDKIGVPQWEVHEFLSSVHMCTAAGFSFKYLALGGKLREFG